MLITLSKKKRIMLITSLYCFHLTQNQDYTLDYEIIQHLNWQEARLLVKPTTCSATSASSIHCLECTLKK